MAHKEEPLLLLLHWADMWTASVRYFILSRCPNSGEEEDWLGKTVKKQYGVEHYGIAAGVFGDSRALIESAVCKKCGLQDVFFDF